MAKVTWKDEISKWDHLKHLSYAVAVGTEKERMDALRKDADITIINRENLQWLIEKSGMPFDYQMVILNLSKRMNSTRNDTYVSKFKTLFFVF